MKKTLLATAIAGALGVTAAAQAATIYDQDGTQVDVYGRINFGFTTGGPQTHDTHKTGGSEFRDVFSRFGFRARHQVSSDLNVFANMELRPQLDRQHNSSLQVRNSFVGLQGDSWGRVQIGNFDGVVYQAITSKYEIQELEGFTTLSGGQHAARGDSIAYSTPNLSGFQAHLQAKHLSGNARLVNGVPTSAGNETAIGAADNSSTVSWQSALTYQWQDLHLGLGYNQSKDVADRGAYYDGGGANDAGEDIWLASVMYDFTPEFRLGLKYEQVTDEFDEADAPGEIEKLWTLRASYDYGMGSIYGDVNHASHIGDQSNSNPWTLGANYRFSQPMYVWAEVHDTDRDASGSDVQNDDVYFTVGVRYDF